MIWKPSSQNSNTQTQRDSEFSRLFFLRYLIVFLFFSCKPQHLYQALHDDAGISFDATLDDEYREHAQTRETQTDNDLYYVEEIVLETGLDRRGIGSFYRGTTRELARIAKLQGHATQTITLYRSLDRLLWVLPKDHPSELNSILLADDMNALIASDEHQRDYWLDRETLPDLLDGTFPSERAAFSTKQGSPTDPLEIEFHLRSPRNQIVDWKIQLLTNLKFQFRHNPHEPQSWLHVVLPHLQASEGYGILEWLDYNTDTTPTILTTISNEDALDSLPPRWATRITSRRWKQKHRHEFAIPPKDRLIRKIHPTPQRSGKQLLSPTDLVGIRASSSTGTLVVTNRSGFSAYLYADGILLGWIAAKSEMTFEGIPTSFYRIYATTPTGIRSWGPADIYIPGSFSLR